MAIKWIFDTFVINFPNTLLLVLVRLSAASLATHLLGPYLLEDKGEMGIRTKMNRKVIHDRLELVYSRTK